MNLSRRDFGKTSLLAIGTAALAGTGTVGCSTSWVTTVENDIPEIVNIVSSILSVISVATGNGAIAGAVGTIVSEAISAFQAALAAFQAAVIAYNGGKGQGTLQAVIDALQSAQQSVQAVVAALPAGSVSPIVDTIIIAGLGTIITILSGIQTLIPGAAPVGVTTAATATAILTKPVLPNGAALRSGFNAVLVLHGYGAQKIQ